ncbi:MAG: hypothetical protein OXF88_23500 [Rhodobacteraceae bacterium]|nr:hypothetical protein [Paracoccaceae bacterium]
MLSYVWVFLQIRFGTPVGFGGLSAEQGDGRARKSSSIIRDSMTPVQVGEAGALIRELDTMTGNN